MRRPLCPAPAQTGAHRWPEQGERVVGVVLHHPAELVGVQRPAGVGVRRPGAAPVCTPEMTPTKAAFVAFFDCVIAQRPPG